MSETSSDTIRRRLYQPFFEELRRLGDIEGLNLTIERYSGEGRREGYADLAREVVNRNPDVIVATTNPVAQALRAASAKPHRRAVFRRRAAQGLCQSRPRDCYPWRDYVAAGRLMAYASDERELWRRMANDVHEILNGTKPGDIPVYQPAKFEFGRHPDLSTGQIRIRHQSESRQGARSHCIARTARGRRRGDRMRRREFITIFAGVAGA
jgi:hypothetical protein